MTKTLSRIFKRLFRSRYIRVEDLVASYDPSTQQVGVAKGALDSVNFKRFLDGKRFEFNGSNNPFVIIPKPRKDDE